VNVATDVGELKDNSKQCDKRVDAISEDMARFKERITIGGVVMGMAWSLVLVVVSWFMRMF
jgi:hypothetical protein